MRFFGRSIQRTLPLLAVVFTLSMGVVTNNHITVRAQQAQCSGPFESVSPALTDLGDANYTRMDGQVSTFKGGLYPNGSNQPPEEHALAGLEASGRIQALDASGNPNTQSGKIVLISIGMSNTNSEFGRFMELANKDPEVNPNLFFINGAQGNRTAERWIDPQADTWQELDSRLARYEVTKEQVQVAWIKQTLTRGGEFPAKAHELQANLEAIARNLKARFPNLQVAFFSSRTRSYTYWRGLSPEPLAFETGFSVKWMIEKQINGDLELNFDPLRGDVKAPYLAWGPYLWADGTNPRSDGLTWTVDDLTQDCTHPTDGGKDKVANLLLAFLKSDPAAQAWFLADPIADPLLVNATVQAPASPTFQSQPTPTSYTNAASQIPTITTDTPPARPTAILATKQETGVLTTPAPVVDEHTESAQSEISGAGWMIGIAGGLMIIVGWIGTRMFQQKKLTRHIKS